MPQNHLRRHMIQVIYEQGGEKYKHQLQEQRRKHEGIKGVMVGRLNRPILVIREII